MAKICVRQDKETEVYRPASSHAAPLFLIDPRAAYVDLDNDSALAATD